MDPYYYEISYTWIVLGNDLAIHSALLASYKDVIDASSVRVKFSLLPVRVCNWLPTTPSLKLDFLDSLDTNFVMHNFHFVFLQCKSDVYNRNEMSY